MKTPIGVIKVDSKGEIFSSTVQYDENNVKVGFVQNLGPLHSITFVVASNSCFVQTSRELNSIIAKVFKTKESKKITFLEALNIHLQSMDHFIRVRKSKN